MANIKGIVITENDLKEGLWTKQIKVSENGERAVMIWYKSHDGKLEAWLGLLGWMNPKLRRSEIVPTWRGYQKTLIPFSSRYNVSLHEVQMPVRSWELVFSHLFHDSVEYIKKDGYTMLCVDTSSASKGSGQFHLLPGGLGYGLIPIFFLNERFTQMKGDPTVWFYTPGQVSCNKCGSKKRIEEDLLVCPGCFVKTCTSCWRVSEVYDYVSCCMDCIKRYSKL